MYFLINKQIFEICCMMSKKGFIMKKQPELTSKTRQKFIDTFCTLYTQKPIEKISVGEITQVAGYNRSTFYQYFSDIYAVLEFVENDLMSYLSELLQNRKNPLETNTPEDIYRLFTDKELYIRAILGEYGSIRFLEQIKKKIANTELTQNTLENNAISPYLLEFHISTSISLFHLWLKREKDISSETLFSLIHTLYTEGIYGVKD